MKTLKSFTLFFLALLALTSCRRSADEVWDDTKTAGRHVGRGFKSLCGMQCESRQVCSREEFLRCHTDYWDEDDSSTDFYTMQYEPLPDQMKTNDIAMAEVTFQKGSKPQLEPGDPMGHIPGIEEFKDPKKDSSLAQIFQNIHFPYNSSLIKGKENMATLHAVADYLRSHRETYLFIEGHCDERGAEAYNLALGARRSNSVRNLLIKNGVSPENIFTVSYGKERPIDSGHSEEAWYKNRRVEFKIYSIRS